MFDAILTPEQKALRDEMRAFVKGVPRQLILDMDADRVRYPREYVEEAAQRNLLGLRFPKEYGGRGLGWTDEIVALEEVGILGTSLACLYSLPSIVGGIARLWHARAEGALAAPGAGGQAHRRRGADRAAGWIRLFRHDDDRPT